MSVRTGWTVDLSALPSPVPPLYGRSKNSPWNSTGPLRSTIDLTIDTYSRVRANGFGYGWPYQPSTTCGPDAPSPSTNRPPERWSIVIAAMAAAAGVRAEICMMLVPSLMVLVLEPHQASGVRQSEP
jgi:hypothetical protein